MSDSMKAAIFLVALIIFFIVLVVLTIVVIAKGRSRAEDMYEDDYDDDGYFEEEEPEEKPRKEKTKKQKKEEPVKEEPPAKDESYDDADDMDFESEFFDMGDDEPEQKEEKPEKTEPEEIPPVTFEDSAFSDSAFSDSAFSDSAFDDVDKLTDFDPFDDGVDEVGITEKLIGPDPEPEAVAPAKKQKGARGKKGDSKKQDKAAFRREEEKLSSGENYWYNRTDVAERPDYKTPEMYYRYFSSVDDAVEDLLTEMYDCALVRTEEIRFIAYGIEPKMIFGNENLLADNDQFVQKFKTKDPGSKDLVKIGEKWCSYVDRLLEIVEIHANADVVADIKKGLYDFGKGDVREILKGK